MSNSSLIDYVKLSPHCNKPRNHKIDTITIHCMAGDLSVETCGNLFQKKEASSNYGIGSDGRIALYVNECDRSWCSSSANNDNRAITIEVASESKPPYKVTDKALNSLIELLVDVCKRNDIKELKWKADKSLIGLVDKQNMTVHRWFKNKDCPGAYLYGLHGYIAGEVNKRLNTPDTFTVKIAVDSLNVRAGAGTQYKINTVVKRGEVFTIVEVSGNWGKLKSGAGWINISSKYVSR